MQDPQTLAADCLHWARQYQFQAALWADSAMYCRQLGAESNHPALWEARALRAQREQAHYYAMQRGMCDKAAALAALEDIPL